MDDLKEDLKKAAAPKHAELIDINRELVELNKETHKKLEDIVEQLVYQVTATYKIVETKEVQQQSDNDWREMLIAERKISASKKRISFYISLVQVGVAILALYSGLIKFDAEVVGWMLTL